MTHAAKRSDIKGLRAWSIALQRRGASGSGLEGGRAGARRWPETPPYPLAPGAGGARAVPSLSLRCFWKFSVLGNGDCRREGRR